MAVKLLNYANMSFKNKLFYTYACILCLCVSLGGGLAFIFLSRIVVADVDSNIERISHSISQSMKLSGEIAVRSYLRAQADANIQMLTDIYEQAMATGQNMDSAKETARTMLLSQKVGKEGYVYCLNGDGTIVVHPVASLVGTSVAEYPFAQEQMKRRNGYLEYEWKNPGENTLRVKALYMEYFSPWDWIVSVSGYQDGFSELVAIGDIETSLQQLKLTPDGATFVIGKNGELVTDGTKGNHVTSDEQTVYHLFADEMIRKKNGRIEYNWKDMGGDRFREHIIIYREIPRFGWIVGIAGHLDEMYGNLHVLKIWIVSITLFLLFIALALSHLIGESFVAPLHGLITCFKRGVAGDYSVRSNRDGKDEFGILGQYFNRFMIRLQEYTEQMESTVDARTKELAHVNSEYLREIKEKTKAEALLREQLAFIDTLLSTIPSPIFYRGCDGRFLGCNKSYAYVVLGTHPDAIRGKTILDYPSVYNSAISMDVMKLDTRMLRTGERVNVEMHIICADGVPRDFMVEKATFKGSEGTVAGIIGVMVDITERKRAEQDRALLERAVERASSAIFIIDATSGEIRYVNNAFEEDTGYAREEVVGTHFRVLFKSSNSEAVVASALETAMARNVWGGRLAILRKGGALYETESSISTILDDQGDLAWLIFVSNDISERVQMETRLLQAQKLESIGQLAAGIAHEINTPVQFVGDNLRFVNDAMTGLLDIVSACNEQAQGQHEAGVASERDEVMLSKISDLDFDFIQAELPRAIMQAQDGVGRITTIVRAMKDFSHPGRKEKQYANVNDALRSTLTVTRNEWKYVAELELDLDETLPEIMCLPAELNQVFMNIIVNGAQAITEKLSGESQLRSAGAITVSGEKGLLRVSTKQDGNRIVIRIGDSGTGIAPENLDHIFDPFYTTKEVGKGTGQGLAIARDVVVNKHQGAIDVESVVGKGTTFIITLPVD